eukprot:545757-Ditylum_brightwellii.AAC.1
MKGELQSPPHHSKVISFVAQPCAGEIACGNVLLALRQKPAVHPSVVDKKNRDEEGKLDALPSVSLLLCGRD